MEAMASCISSGGDEEEGGVILQNGEEYQFIRIRNENTGTPIAGGLYTMDKGEYGSKVLGLTEHTGWIEFASFHTHPNGCRAYPSSIDLKQLFTGFPINFIYVPWSEELNVFEYKKDKSGSNWELTPLLKPTENYESND